MSSVRLPLNIPLMEEESHAPTDLSGRIHVFCKEWKEKRKQEWGSHKGKSPIPKWLKTWKEQEMW